MSKALLDKYKDNPLEYYKALEGSYVVNSALLGTEYDMPYLWVYVKPDSFVVFDEMKSNKKYQFNNGEFWLYPNLDYTEYWVIRSKDFDRELDSL